MMAFQGGRDSYERCDLMGEGRILAGTAIDAAEFKVIDMTPSGVRIRTDKKMRENELVRIELRFSGYIRDIDMLFEGEVSAERKRRNGYEYFIRFHSITSEQSVEIDEIIRKGCPKGRGDYI